MAAGPARQDAAIDPERLGILSLWAVPTLGPKSLATVQGFVGGKLAPVLSVPAREWAIAISLPPAVRRFLDRVEKTSELGERILERAGRTGMKLAFPGDAAFPANLVALPDAPPVLFFRGTPSSPRRRIAMVGSRRPDNGFLRFARKFAVAVAQAGVGIISGAAEGVDRECHLGAFDAGAETWAFLGSALDELDRPQAGLLPQFLRQGGMFYSELPPGVRASRTTFPRRNRLISGAADAVLVLRADEQSGALHTARAAAKQGRPLLALPGDPYNPSAAGCNQLLRSGEAQICLTPEDAWLALQLKPSRTVKAAAGVPFDLNQLSPNARKAYLLLGRTAQSFDDVLRACEIPSAALISALCELELRGLVAQHPGKRYERI